MSRKDLHDILGEALGRAKAGDLESVRTLNKQYSDIKNKVYSDRTSDLDTLYDHCMGSCIQGAGAIMAGQREAFLEEAESIYKGLPIPEDL